MRAARVAVEMAQKYKAELVALHMIPTIRYALAVTGPSATLPPGVYEEYSSYEKGVGEGFVRRVVDMANTAGVKANSAVQESHGSTVEGITNYALGEHLDLIVIGTRGLSGFKKLVIGSVSSGVVNHAHCPVLVVR